MILSMLTSVEASIYLSNFRGCTQDENHRSYHTFNFGSYFNEYRKGFGKLIALNDETMSGGYHYRYKAVHDSVVVLLPMVGSVQFNENENEKVIEAGQVCTFCMAAGTDYTLRNPFESELVNYLHLIFHDDGSNCASVHEFDLHQQSNQLIALNNVDRSPCGIEIFIGKYDGRAEGSFFLNDPQAAFVFALEGAFEVQNRLLHARDGLALRKTDFIEFEALSNEAIILVIKM